MKIGIITFHRAINYGAILQTYALQKCLKEYLKIENEVIDYYCKYLENEYKLISNYKYCGNYKGKILLTLNLISVIAKKIKFRKFLGGNIKISAMRKISKKNIYKNCGNNYNVYIAGSDQVWNFKNTEFDATYFLDFVRENEKKKSYAASFGFDEIPQKYVSDYKRLLSSFSDISVREAQGALIMQQLCRKNVPIMIDPTLLLNKNEWMKLCKSKIRVENYILVFCVNYSPTISSFVEQLEIKSNCRVGIINDRVLENIKLIRSIGIGPEEFLELFTKARYIVTDSFHGTAFSINFNKDFFVELQSVSDNTNSRITHLLSMVNLKNRIINYDMNMDYTESIDYEKVNSLLNEERRKALDYLKKISI